MKRVLNFTFACIAAFSISPLIGQENIWEFDHESQDVSFDANGNVDTGDGIISLSINSPTRIITNGEDMEIFSVNNAKDVLVRIPDDTNEVRMTYLLKKPSSLTASDLAGFWVYKEFTIEENGNGPENHEFSIAEIELEFKADGSLLDEDGLNFAAFTINANQHVIVTTTGGEIIDFGINNGKDLMLSTSSAENSHSFRLLGKMGLAITNDDITGEWTYITTAVENVEVPAIFGQEAEVLDIKNDGTFGFVDDVNDTFTGTYTTEGKAGTVSFTDEEGFVVTANINSASNFIMLAASGAGIAGVTLITRDADDLALSDLEGNWTVFSLEIKQQVDSDFDGMDDNWEWDNFKTLANDGTDDADKDSISDKFEFITNTDPNDSNSAFFFTFAVDESNMENHVFIFPTLDGIEYIIQSSLSLSSWGNLSSVIGDGQLQTISVASLGGYPGANKVFFRILVQPASGG